MQTVRNRVRASGFSSRKPAKKPQLSQRHRALRRHFAHVTANGIDSNGYESSSLMNPDLSAKGGWIYPSMASQRGETHRTYCPTNNGKQRWKCYVMIWAGISLNGRTALVGVPGNLNGRRYTDEILRHHGVPYLRQIGQNAIFQDDNARPHRARIMDSFLQRNGVQRLEWLSMSPDLSCIEHL